MFFLLLTADACFPLKPRNAFIYLIWSDGNLGKSKDFS
jgi:hypothetical protein